MLSHEDLTGQKQVCALLGLCYTAALLIALGGLLYQPLCRHRAWTGREMGPVHSEPRLLLLLFAIDVA
jgi:hypothetical protein